MIAFEKVLAAVIEIGWSRLSNSDARNHAKHLFRAMEQYEVNDEWRAAAFLAQWAHETGGWRWMRELGGPSYFDRYDGRKDLGNTEPGDGYRYRGRGYCMLTGRRNYTYMGNALALPLVEQPDMAELPAIASRIAGRYWEDKQLNELADEGKFKSITMLINGGLNGFEDRKKKYYMAKRVLEREGYG